MVRFRTSEDWVNGQVYCLRDPEKQLAWLDDYEGAAYRRTMLRAITSTGRTIRCWAYLYRFRLRR
jgi:gamma-glutamylcyclotransferase (GGCT)/AIG2-like uncharacterized protein YtfP